MAERLSEVNPDDLVLRLSDVDPADMEEGLNDVDPADMAEGLNEVNPDDMVGRLNDVNPDDMVGRLNEVNPDDILGRLNDVDPADMAERLNDVNPDDIEEGLNGVDLAEMVEGLNDVELDGMVNRLSYWIYLLVLSKILIDANSDETGESLCDVNSDDTGASLSDVGPDEMGEQLSDVDSDEMGEQLSDVDSDEMGEQLSDVDSDEMGEELSDVDSDDKDEGLNEVNPDDTEEGLDGVDPADMAEGLNDVDLDGMAKRLNCLFLLHLLWEILSDEGSDDTRESLSDVNSDDMGERLSDVAPDDIGERLNEVNLHDRAERLSDVDSNDMGEGLSDFDADVTEDGLSDVDPDDMGERLNQVNPANMLQRLNVLNPDKLMLYYERLENKLMMAHQYGHISGALSTLSPKEMNESIIIAATRGLYKVLMCLIDQRVDLSLQYIDDKKNNILHLVLHSIYTPTCGNKSDLLLCVIKLVEAGVDVNHPNKYEQTPILVAANEGLYSIVIYLLEHGANVHYVDIDKDNLLHIVLCRNGRETDELVNCVTKLVEAGVNVNHLNQDNQTAVCIAARKGLYTILIYLLGHCACVHYTDKNNLLHVVLESYTYVKGDVVAMKLLTCVTKLVEAGADVNNLNKYKQTPIFIAARKRLYKIMLYLLRHGASVHYVDIKDRTILYCVLYYIYEWGEDNGDTYDENLDCSPVVKTLINMGVDVNKPDKYGNTPMFNVQKRNKMKLGKGRLRLQYNLITTLINAGCNVNHQNNGGKTPLMYYTLYRADISILKLLIQHCNANLTDNSGDTACSYCVKYHHNCTNILKLYSRDVLKSPNNGINLTSAFPECKRPELFNYYFELQLSVNGLEDVVGDNMLHGLARVNVDYSLDKFKWLFNNELDINLRGGSSNTPIMEAALLLNSKYVELLTHHPRIDINAQNGKGHTALHLCIIGFTEVKNGLNNRQNKDVVEYYCRRIYPKYMECVDNLLAVVGIDVNIQSKVGRTALMMAAMKNDRCLIRKLLDAGALVNYNGKSALHHLDIFESMFDLSFKLLVSAGDHMLLNLPCINGNTLIQETLRFPRCWDPRTAVRFIKYLIGENCFLQSLVTSPVKSSYNQIDMRELSSQERDELRKLLYLSGAPANEIVATLNFEKEDKNVERDDMRRLLYLRGASGEVQHLNFGNGDEADDTFRSRNPERFTNYCCNISLRSRCRRIIRQKLGLDIKKTVMNLELPCELRDFLLLKDVLLTKDYSIDDIDDRCNDFDDDDGFGGYDED